MFSYLVRKWKNVRSATSEVDVTFLALRVLCVAGGISWLAAGTLAPEDQAIFGDALILFSLYSLACYYLIFMKPEWLRNVYHASLFLDLLFLTYLIRIEPHLDNSFFIGYYLLICLHTIYFGLRFGLLVASLSTLLYCTSVSHILSRGDWPELALRVAFLFVIAVPVGMLSERVRREKSMVESLNEELAKSLRVLRETQEKLIEAEKFSALGRMTAYITHEIRNPLTALGGFARRLEKRLPGGSTEKEYAEMITKEAARLERILLDTLIYGKVQDISLSRQDINEPIRAAIARYRELCSEQGIHLTEHLEPNLPKGKIDPEQVQKALDSLIYNSIQAMPEGGDLTIESGLVTLNMTEFLTICVMDTGGGMDPEILNFVFEPFYSTKRIGHGTGLGLPIVKKIMDEHQGRVEIDNCHGSGMAVTLYFPYQSEKQDQMTPCWEFLGCGIETDPGRQCGAYPHFGRICWSTAGSYSTKQREGICARKIDDCRNCAFFQMVTNPFPLYIPS
ncbi:MAG: hypothetical protein Kow0089_11930 [Desulfobulbaceae bacterium]